MSFNVQLATTSFDCNTQRNISVLLFSAIEECTYHFSGTLTATTANDSFGYGLLVNGTYKDLWTVNPSSSLDVNLDFTADVGDVITLQASGVGTGSNLVVTKESKKIYIGEGTGQDYSAMRGPCPEGFHVPQSSEWEGLKSIMDGLSLTTGNNWRINLHMPFAGFRDIDASLYSQGSDSSDGNYWSSSPDSESSDGARLLYLDLSTVDADYSNLRACGISVRCFKDSYVTPDSSWTVVQGTLGSAGIFWNQSEGLISITNGTTGYTIMDKNLGATTVYNDGDTLTQANMGNMYQWGNNYGFPSTGTIANTSSTQVDASDYGPGNYYSSSTFITWSSDWSNPSNDNLRGGETGIRGFPNVEEIFVGEGTTVDDYSAMQGPAPSGYHVPSSSELVALCGILTNTFSMGANATTMGTYLKMPKAGLRSNSTSNVSDVDTYGHYWSHTAENANFAYSLRFYPRGAAPLTIHRRADGLSIRCFKDSPTVPTSSWTTLYDGSSVATGAGVFYNATDGLISVSGDGTTWYTIQDKNLGATTVYNQGDTLTDANCGYFYQWGNNYGFPHSGTVTTSSTQVDASNYGPGNYYNSSTFITGSNDWSSVQNDDLRGLETGITKKGNVKEVYIGTTKVRTAAN